MAKVKGKDILVEIEDAGVWKPFGCAISCDLDVTTEMIETSETGAGSFATFLPSKISFTGSLTGYTDLTMFSLRNFRLYQIAGTKFRMKITRTSGTDTYYDIGYFFVTNTHDESSYKGFSSYTVDIQGTGALQINTDIVNTPFTYKFGRTVIDESLPYISDAAKWFFINSAVNDANDNVEYSTGTASDVTSPITINYGTDFGIQYLIYPATIDDFTLWDEVGNVLQQNIPVSNGSSGTWRAATLTTGEKAIIVRFTTAFTNAIKFHR